MENKLMENLESIQNLDIEKMIGSEKDDKNYVDVSFENKKNTDVQSAIEEVMMKTPSKLQNDISHYKSFKKNKMTAEMFERVYENEQTVFFQENKRFMNSKEKKMLRKNLIKMIDKGLLFVNEIGQIKTRKSNYTEPTKKSRKK